MNRGDSFKRIQQHIQSYIKQELEEPNLKYLFLFSDEDRAIMTNFVIQDFNVDFRPDMSDINLTISFEDTRYSLNASLTPDMKIKQVGDRPKRLFLQSENALQTFLSLIVESGEMRNLLSLIVLINSKKAKGERRIS